MYDTAGYNRHVSKHTCRRMTIFTTYKCMYYVLRTQTHAHDLSLSLSFSSSLSGCLIPVHVTFILSLPVTDAYTVTDMHIHSAIHVCD